MIDVLRRGLLEEVQLEQDVIGQIFPCLDDLITLHRNFLTEMESRHHYSTHLSNSDKLIVQRIGDVLLQQVCVSVFKCVCVYVYVSCLYVSV